MTEQGRGPSASGGAPVDLFVIGGGSGGVRAARVAGQHGAKVAIAERSRWGGTCVVRGCVPKKLLVYASAVSAQLADARGYGWRIGEATLDWPALRDALGREVDRLSVTYRATLERHGVTLLEGTARLRDARTVELLPAPQAPLRGSAAAPGAGDERASRSDPDVATYQAKQILIATGGAPRRPAIPGAETMLTSDDVFTLPALPPRLVVVGGGYIGLEMAHIFAGLGSRVTLVHHGELPLRGFDAEVRAAAAANLRARGVEMIPGCEPLRVDGGLVHLSTCGPIETDAVLAAVGRLPATAGLGLEEIGVTLDDGGAIVVDEWQRTSVAGVHAVGDVTGRHGLTPVAIREGQAFADTVFGGRPTPFLPDHVPTAVFAQPPIAAVGLTEEEARARGEITVHRAAFKPMRNALPGRDERVLIKLICDAGSRRVLGLHVVGDDSPEIVQAAAIAIAMGATKEDLDRTVALHPTVAEELVLLR